MGASAGNFHYAAVGREGGWEFFRGRGTGCLSHRKSNTMVIRAKTPSILRFTSSIRQPKNPAAEHWKFIGPKFSSTFLSFHHHSPPYLRRCRASFLPRQASRYHNNLGLLDVEFHNRLFSFPVVSRDFLLWSARREYSSLRNIGRSLTGFTNKAYVY